MLKSTPRQSRRGLIIVYSGHGKGKTTAALGMALRACGHSWKTVMIQFIKGTWHYGELEAAKLLAPNFEIVPMGRGCYKLLNDRLSEEEHRQAAREALDFARQKIRSQEYDMVILDEINVAVKMGLLAVEDVLALLDEKPPYLHLVLTGRDADPRIIERADLVTEMCEVKHPYAQGIKGQVGIEF
jgi:cob(I)alamin adenosyltransferase